MLRYLTRLNHYASHSHCSPTVLHHDLINRQDGSDEDPGAAGQGCARNHSPFQFVCNAVGLESIQKRFFETVQFRMHGQKRAIILQAFHVFLYGTLQLRILLSFLFHIYAIKLDPGSTTLFLLGRLFRNRGLYFFFYRGFMLFFSSIQHGMKPRFYFLPIIAMHDYPV